MFKLELVAGASDAPTDHPGWFDPGSSLAHPAHERIRGSLSSHGIAVEVVPSLEHGVYYSDAYVSFKEDQLPLVIEALEAEDFPGYVLDGALDNFSDEMLMKASQMGWGVEVGTTT